MDLSARAAWTSARPGKDHPVDAACVAPWVSLEFDPQGWVYTCCANQLYPLGRIGDERLGELWAGDRARVLRTALQRWDTSSGCGSCRWHLEHGRVDTDAAVYDRYHLASTEPAGPASMTFALSNRCNLGCVMCNGELSSTLRHEAGLPPIVSRYDDQFFEDLVPFLPGLQYAKFLGGEPFLIPEHERVWRLMDEVGGPPRLQVTTNGTVWTDRADWLLDRFVVDITVSVDAYSAAGYERIRRGAKHSTLLDNIERFRTRCAASGAELRLCFCLMADNVDELAPFLRWADRLGVPVSVNVVSDEGLALHDGAIDHLEAVQRAWEAEEDHDRPGGLNAEVWDTQRAQLAAVLDERRRGIGPAPRQAQRATPGFFAHPAPPSSTDQAPDIDDERDRLAAWGQGPVAELHVDADGLVAGVTAARPDLGLDESLVGRRAGELVDVLTAATGRALWILGLDQVGSAVVRTAVLATGQPVRGAPGTVVRCVSTPVGDRWTVLIATDHIHERSTAASVAVPAPRRARPG